MGRLDAVDLTYSQGLSFSGPGHAEPFPSTARSGSHEFLPVSLRLVAGLANQQNRKKFAKAKRKGQY